MAYEEIWAYVPLKFDVSYEHNLTVGEEQQFEGDTDCLYLVMCQVTVLDI